MLTDVVIQYHVVGGPELAEWVKAHQHLVDPVHTSFTGNACTAFSVWTSHRPIRHVQPKLSGSLSVIFSPLGRATTTMIYLMLTTSFSGKH